ncbi:MAG: ABC transporter ATP-binding protein [Opitutae bacterium]|jgi:ABC-type sugar transport system ATPase subunit|nr:ABC transporter ATP-binding protein [Opitutae bacterium]|tara:strand:+ start:570 stop:1211 length:642 start_codon:yes stop_codon:yes gene_type:complete
MISVEKLQIRQGEFSLSSISLKLPKGAYGIIVGRSGCGKTTLLEAVCGLRPIDRGRILLGSEDVTTLKPGERGVGYVPQDGALFPHLSVARQLAFALILRKAKPKQIQERVEELAERLGVTHLLDRMPDALSGGERQRVALGRALSIRPRYLCLDEPLSALDDETYDEIYELLLQTVKGTGVTVLHITHNKREVENLADIVFRIAGNELSCEK